MAISLRRVKSRFHLGRLFITGLVMRILFFWKRKKAAQRFLDQYYADCIHPFSESERGLMPAFQRCQVCSLCTFTCASVVAGTAPASFEPKMLMLALGRSSQDSEVFLDEWLPCVECTGCTAECPTGVPLHAMASEIVERRKGVRFRS